LGWGRRGSPGTVRPTSYRRCDDAEAAELRTIKRRLQKWLHAPRSSAE
jgi:predicted DNA-binding WGR domain protein